MDTDSAEIIRGMKGAGNKRFSLLNNKIEMSTVQVQTMRILISL
jgi:hypothetical protein